ncbi:SDR family oxidoreductase [Streptomyces sp. NEAU-sy36]|uniref:SDR family NAD(P)-dependent oxidoreductase n=1 Tax=unclassified Streptomyces TaxID=2593676 RepID=UPI0015D5C357|nr:MULTISPECIES: SDR family oxidoreductase [unclassified Streptomyces]QLJ04015.1 SDR family oxidoreductase [Streptomyces sp. NEAU-sy36]
MTWPSGESAFVTGAASGIGLGIARALVARGAKVALVDLDGDKLAAAAAELGAAGGSAVAIGLDVSAEDRWTDAADRAEAALGPVSILVNNAGVISAAPLTETTFENWRRHFRVNVDGQFLGTSVFLPRFLERGGRAHILNTASMGGLIPVPGVGAYSASKFASVGLSLALREELRDTGVRVSVLCPGTVATGMTAAGTTSEHPAGADPDRVGEQVVEAMEAGRFFIPTHPDFAPIVTELHREIEQALRETDDRHGPDPSVRMILGGVDPVDKVLRPEAAR